MKTPSIDKNLSIYQNDLDAIIFKCSEARKYLVTGASAEITALATKHADTIAAINAGGSKDDEKVRKAKVESYEDDITLLNTALASAATALNGITF